VGAGLVTLGVPASLHATLAGHFPEATWLLLPEELGVIASEAAPLVRAQVERATALLMGPGFGLEPPTREFLDRLLEAPSVSDRKAMGFLPGPAQAKARGAARAAGGALPPMVVDADGLKLLAQLAGWQKRLPAESVLTPHPGEMAVLTGLSKEELQADRLAAGERFAGEWGHVVVFKGAFTVIAAPDGRSALIPVATPALARAGTGDVLAGMIVGLLAQGVPAYEAAAAAAWLHAQAGLMSARDLGSAASVLAGDVARRIPAVLAGLAGEVGS
jgi:NAD(P)H-hydrate epimerase